MYDTTLIIQAIDGYLERSRRKWCSTAEAGRELVKERLLWGCDEDPGKGVREMIYNEELPYAYKEGRIWRIPESPEGYVQSLQNRGRKKRVSGSAEDLLYGMGLFLGVPFLLFGIILTVILSYDSPPNESLEKYATPDWASGLDSSVPANQVSHYDIPTRTAIYRDPVVVPPPITHGEYEANKRRSKGKTVIRAGEEVYEIELSPDEVVGQLMDELDFWECYEEFCDR